MAAYSAHRFKHKNVMLKRRKHKEQEHPQMEESYIQKRLD
jgi:hypothetical protein